MSSRKGSPARGPRTPPSITPSAAGLMPRAPKAQRRNRRCNDSRNKSRSPSGRRKNVARRRNRKPGRAIPSRASSRRKKNSFRWPGWPTSIPKVRSAELREEMKQASQAIARDPARMRAAEREGIAPQIRNFVRQAERESGREKGKDLDRDEGLER